MEIKVLNTNEISKEMWCMIVSGFNKSFNLEKETYTLTEYYKHTRKGYSYHALAIDNNKIIGYNSIIPFLYKDNLGKDFYVGISGGTFILKEYRKEIFLFSDLIKALLTYCSKEGVALTLGVSNENSFNYALKFLNATFISYIPYFVLPVRVFNIINKRFSFLNFFSIFFTKTLLKLNIFFSRRWNFSELNVRFEIQTDEIFYKNRFADAHYKKINTSNVKTYYRVVIENGVRTVYIFDFRENEYRTYHALVKSIKYVFDTEKPDLILFIGHLRLKQYILIRLPHKMEPQHLPLTFNITSDSYNSYFKDASAEINWNFSLMNFDVR